MTTVLPAHMPHTSRITRRQWLTGDVFTLGLARPAVFTFIAGQRVRLHLQGQARDYSLIPGPHPNELELLIRALADGNVSSHLSRCPLNTTLDVSEPGGHFIYRPSPRQAVFIATGTGIAPFVAMCRDGVQGFVMLHGVRAAGDLYYREIVESAAVQFIPCLTGPLTPTSPDSAFAGRVTQYLRAELAPGAYDFYLAGRGEMIADAMAIVDARFPDAHVYTEIFF